MCMIGWLADKATIASGLCLKRSEVLRGFSCLLTDYLQVQSKDSYTIDHVTSIQGVTSLMCPVSTICSQINGPLDHCFHVLSPMWPCTQPKVAMYSARCGHVFSPKWPCTPPMWPCIQPKVAMYSAQCGHVLSPMWPCIQPEVAIYSAISGHLLSPMWPCTQLEVAMYSAQSGHVLSQCGPWTDVCTGCS